MHHRVTGILLALLVFLLVHLFAYAGSADWLLWQPGSISQALSKPDGTPVNVDAVVLTSIQQGDRAWVLVVREPWASDIIIHALCKPIKQLTVYQTVDLQGIMGTFPDGRRVLLCRQIAIYLDKNGYPACVPPIKGILDISAWPWKVWLDTKANVTEAEAGAAGISSASIMAEGDPQPPGDPEEPQTLDLPPTGSIARAKTIPDNESLTATIAGKRVTVATGEFAGNAIYIEKTDRSCGIRVVPSGGTFARGNEVEITAGTVKTSSGERYIDGAAVSRVGAPGELSPVGMPQRNMGGGDFPPGSAVYQQGVDGGYGLNNIGLLVKTWGKVTYNGGSYVYIDDGSAVDDGSGHIGVRVETDHLALGNSIIFPTETEGKVEVTGISSCMILDNEIVRVLRPRSQEDIAIPSIPSTKPQIPQGSSETFDANVPGDPPQGSVQWDIVLGGNQVATSDQPNGWLVTFSSRQKFMLAVPIDADVAADYQVRYSEGSTTAMPAG
ncbi:MAG: hypothetical protein QMD10_09025 [Desulfitobacteriaceae bacterium]|nr:hypothetical protein [Desulfitobacteriaceae bacterium]